MSELKEMSIILFTNLSKALLRTAQEISKSMEKEIPIITNNPPPLTVGLDVLIAYKKRRYWAAIIKIDGDILTVENKVVGLTLDISTSQVIMRSDIDYDIDLIM
jgi:hypothetical protein